MNLDTTDWRKILKTCCEDLRISPREEKSWETKEQWELAVTEALCLQREVQSSDAYKKSLSHQHFAIEHYTALSKRAKDQMEMIENSLMIVSGRSEYLSKMTDDFLYDWQMSLQRFNDIYDHCERVMAAFWLFADFVTRVGMPTDSERWEGQRRVRKILRGLGLDDTLQIQRLMLNETAFDLKEDKFYLSEYPEFYTTTKWFMTRGKRRMGIFNI